MSHEKPTGHNLESLKLTALDEQRFELHKMQAEQAQILETSGIADKAREVLISKHRNLTERYRASDLAVDPPPAPRVGNDGGVTRAVVASSTRKRNGAKIECPSVLFITTDLHGSTPHEHYQFAPVGEIHKDGILPIDGFSPEDVTIVEGLLGEVQDAKARGLLPDLTNSMATISKLGMDLSISMSEVPRITP